jgi:hypothetical protein
VSGPVQDPRAGEILTRFHELFAGSPELPVQVDAIPDDLLGLGVGESESLEVSRMLLPAERQVWLRGTEVAPRRRFTLAHELGHWVCQCLEGRTAPVYCRSDEVGVGSGARGSARRTCSRRNSSCPSRSCKRASRAQSRRRLRASASPRKRWAGGSTTSDLPSVRPPYALTGQDNLYPMPSKP